MAGRIDFDGLHGASSLLAQHITNSASHYQVGSEKFLIIVSRATLRQALRQAGFRWTRPKLVLPRRPDPMIEQKRAKLAQVLANPSATVIAEDEKELFHTYLANPWG